MIKSGRIFFFFSFICINACGVLLLVLTNHVSLFEVKLGVGTVP